MSHLDPVLFYHCATKCVGPFTLINKQLSDTTQNIQMYNAHIFQISFTM